MRRIFWLLLGVFLSLAVQAVAQDNPVPSRPVAVAQELPQLSKVQTEELRQWLSKMKKWEEYERLWFNRFPKGDNGNIIRKRKLKPEPPLWLPSFCQQARSSYLPDDLSLGCLQLLSQATRLDPLGEEIAIKTQTERSDREKLEKGTFLSRLHLDGLWTQPQIGGETFRMYGLVGSHISLIDVGRLQFYGPPGIILIRVPDTKGNRQLRVGYTWGMSFRLKDFQFPLTSSRNATLYLNLTKCWLGPVSVGQVSINGVDFAGFSISPKKK
jgi:hypothetical protein